MKVSHIWDVITLKFHSKLHWIIMILAFICKIRWLNIDMSFFPSEIFLFYFIILFITFFENKGKLIKIYLVLVIIQSINGWLGKSQIFSDNLKICCLHSNDSQENKLLVNKICPNLIISVNKLTYNINNYSFIKCSNLFMLPLCSVLIHMYM